MATTSDYLNQLVTDKANIIQAIQDKGVEVDDDAKFTDLASKIGDITGGGGSPEPKPTGHADVEGLKTIGWTDEDIANFQEYGVFWNEEEDDDFALTDEELLGQGKKTDRYLPKSYSGYLYEKYYLIGIPSNLSSSSNNSFEKSAKIRYIPIFNKIGTSANRCFNNCYNLKKIEKINTSSITDFMSAFAWCSSLTEIPQIDTSKGVNFTSTFTGCVALETIPLLDTSKATNMSSMFYSCNKLTKVPLLDTSNVTNMNNMFYGCTSLKEIPLFNTSKVQNMSSMFSGCRLLKEIPLFDTSSVGTFQTFLTGTNIRTIPLLDTSYASGMSSMFSSCYALEEIPLINTSKAQNMGSMFQNCVVLEEIPQLDTSRASNMSSMFNSCYAIRKIPELSGKSCTSISNFVSNCTNLKEFGGLKDIGKAYITTISANYSYYTFAVSSSDLTYESVMNVINKVYDIASAGCNTQKLVLGTANKSKVTADEIAIATAKGWTVS